MNDYRDKELSNAEATVVRWDSDGLVVALADGELRLPLVRHSMAAVRERLPPGTLLLLTVNHNPCGTGRTETTFAIRFSAAVN